MARWLLLIDLDGTLWSHTDISLLTPPFKKIDENVIIDRYGERIELNREMVKFIEWARANHAVTSTLSWNIYEIAYEAIKAFGVDGMFDYFMIDTTPRKDLMIKNLLYRIKKDMGIDIAPEQMVYIDDRDIHIDDIWSNVGKVFFIRYIWGSMDSDYLIKKVKKYLESTGIL